MGGVCLISSIALKVAQYGLPEKSRLIKEWVVC